MRGVLREMPRSTTFEACVYPVRRVPSDDPDVGKGYMGCIDDTAEIIKLVRGITPLLTATTFLHEVGHHIFDANKLTIPDRKLEEDVLSAFALGMVIWMRDNPDWVEWIVAVANRARRPKCQTRTKPTRPSQPETERAETTSRSNSKMEPPKPPPLK